jgi:hypothetical protein
MNDKRPLLWLIAFGVVRHTLVIVGMWLLRRGWIDAETHEQFADPGTAIRLLSWLLIVAPIGWSALQKWQVWGWLRTKVVKIMQAEMTMAAIRTEPSPQTIIVASPGPDMPI